MRQTPFYQSLTNTQLVVSTQQALAAIIEVMVCCQFLFKTEALGLGSGGTVQSSGPDLSQGNAAQIYVFMSHVAPFPRSLILDERGLTCPPSAVEERAEQNNTPRSRGGTWPCSSLLQTGVEEATTSNPARNCSAALVTVSPQPLPCPEAGFPKASMC